LKLIVDDSDTCFCFFFQAEDGIRDRNVTGVQTCALPISGDVVGIIPMKGGSEATAQTNIAYTCNGSVFEAGSPYYFQDRDAVTFNAYYPYDENLADNRRIGINTRAENQTVETVNENSWNKNDYLFATKETTVSTPEISFTEDEGNPFRHVMSKFTLTLKAGDGITNLNAL